jgi:hypothetical protein
MEIGQDPNWGCSAKKKTQFLLILCDSHLISFLEESGLSLMRPKLRTRCFLDVNQRICESISTISARNLQQVRELLTPQIKLATLITTFLTRYAGSTLLLITYQMLHEIN